MCVYTCVYVCASSQEYFRSFFSNIRCRMVVVVATSTATKGDEDDGDDKKKRKEYKCTQTR
jgi:hypothetical protein